jgi:CPA1 family monovalent cation:H+ antiporter
MSGLGEAWQLVGHAAAIWLALLVLRFVWIWCGIRVAVRWAKRRGQDRDLPSLRLMGAATLAGIRGAVTLAGILSVPLTMPDGAPFPARDLLIFLASGVILFSLLGGCFGLPPLLRGLQLPLENPYEHEEREARTLAAEAAIRAIEGVQQQWAISEERRQPSNGVDAAIYTGITANLLTHYRQRIEATKVSENNREWASCAASFEREVHLTALRAERTELYRLRSIGRINDETLRTLVDEIDLIEASLLASGRNE